MHFYFSFCYILPAAALLFGYFYIFSAAARRRCSQSTASAKQVSFSSAVRVKTRGATYSTDCPAASLSGREMPKKLHRPSPSAASGNTSRVCPHPHTTIDKQSRNIVQPN
jgi:hypothetical protein